jgi:polysaccharide biosynthesis transport protein
MAEPKEIHEGGIQHTDIGGGIQTSDDPGLNIQRYLQVLLKRKWLILSVLVVVLGATAVWTFSRTKIYRATATVIIEQKAPQVLGSQVNEVVDLSQGGYWRNKEYMETQRKVISSSALARQVAEKLHLASNSTFWGPAKDATRRAHSTDEAAIVLAGLVAATPTRDSNILEIAVEHADAELAARLANAVTQAFMDQNVEYKFTSTSGAVKWLSDQLDDLKKQLEKTELALYEYKKKYNIISLSLEDKQSILARQIEKVTDGLTEIRMKRMALDAQRKQILAARAQNKGNDPLKIAVGPVMENPVIQKLKEVVVDENRKYTALREKYEEKWPAVREQKARYEAARRDLEREVNNLLTSLESKYKEVRDNESQVASALQSAKEEALDLNRREVPYQQLKRQQENTAKLYSLMLSRMKESDLSAQLRVNNIRSLDPAVAPRVAVSPRVRINLMIGLLLGLVLGIGLAFIVDALDNSIKSQEDVDAVAELVFLGLMPRIPGSLIGRNGRRPDPKPELDLIVHRNPKSSVAESCRAIRTNVLFASADRAMKVIMVTSPGPKEGKTTTAVSLAIAMAQAGAKVLIVDTDMRRPRLHRIFGVPGSEGITSVLLDKGKLEEVIKTTEVPDLYVLPCGPIPPNPAELCQGERFKSLLGELCERFDRVLLDSPPVMVVTDAVVLGTIVDGTLLVARTSQTTRGGLRETVRQLRDVGGRILGCVMNDMDLEKRGYGYYRYRQYGYYRYGYSKYSYGHYGDKEEEEVAH